MLRKASNLNFTMVFQKNSPQADVKHARVQLRIPIAIGD